jgi:hypothetical protein
MSFILKSQLKSHVQRVHENKKKYKCELFEYSAFEQRNIRTHIECVQENLKPHQCNICQKTFGQMGKLKKEIGKPIFTVLMQKKHLFLITTEKTFIYYLMFSKRLRKL